MKSRSGVMIGQFVNLTVPGGGLILIGSAPLGVLIAVLFTATANFAIAATLLIPDDVSPTWRGLCAGLAIGTYLGAQIRYAQTVRSQRNRTAADRRHSALHVARTALAAGHVDDAWRAIEPLAGLADDDLVLAHRLAQVLTARGDPRAALEAWQRVRRLDRHRLYRDEIAQNDRVLADIAGKRRDLLSPGARDA